MSGFILSLRHEPAASMSDDAIFSICRCSFILVRPLISRFRRDAAARHDTPPRRSLSPRSSSRLRAARRRYAARRSAIDIGFFADSYFRGADAGPA